MDSQATTSSVEQFSQSQSQIVNVEPRAQQKRFKVHQINIPIGGAVHTFTETMPYVPFTVSRIFVKNCYLSQTVATAPVMIHSDIFPEFKWAVVAEQFIDTALSIQNEGAYDFSGRTIDFMLFNHDDSFY